MDMQGQGIMFFKPKQRRKNMYKYGMRLRGFSIGCQPMNGLIDWQDTEGKYYSELTYSRKLTTEECEQYELDYIGET